MKHAASCLFQACKHSSRLDIGAVASIEHELTGSGRDFSIGQWSAYSGGTSAEWLHILWVKPLLDADSNQRLVPAPGELVRYSQYPRHSGVRLAVLRWQGSWLG